MIINEYNCLFVHIPKCAGQSIERYFLRLLGESWETRSKFLLRLRKEGELGPPRLAHLKAEEYIKYDYLSLEQFQDFYKFAIVRNPWSRMVSFYRYLGYDSMMSFKNFVRFAFPKVFRKMNWFVCPQKEFVFNDKDQLLVDQVLRFENLESEFNQLCIEMNIPEGHLPRSNASASRAVKKNIKIALLKLLNDPMLINYLGYDNIKSNNYKDYYNDELKGIVAAVYKKDVETFEYEF